MYLMYKCNVSDTHIPRNLTIMEGKLSVCKSPSRLDRDPDHHQNLTTSSFYYLRPLH